MAHVVKLVLIHDLVEIDAGDTYCYDAEGQKDKAARENQAATRLFGLLPPDQADELWSLWREFEARETPEAAFASALDRLMPMVGHLAWQEQAYFLGYGQGITLDKQLARTFANGAAASTPPLSEVRTAWQRITAAADPWLDAATVELLQAHVVSQGKPIAYTHGNLLQRVIYHYWYHAGEMMAVRQLLGHERLPQFVGALDRKAPYRPESPQTSDESQ